MRADMGKMSVAPDFLESYDNVETSMRTGGLERLKSSLNSKRVSRIDTCYFSLLIPYILVQRCFTPSHSYY